MNKLALSIATSVLGLAFARAEAISVKIDNCRKAANGEIVVEYRVMNTTRSTIRVPPIVDPCAQLVAFAKDGKMLPSRPTVLGGVSLSREDLVTLPPLSQRAGRAILVVKKGKGGEFDLIDRSNTFSTRAGSVYIAVWFSCSRWDLEPGVKAWLGDIESPKREIRIDKYGAISVPK